jgi:hypothetical protein
MTVSTSATTNSYETFWNSWQPGETGERNNGNDQCQVKMWGDLLYPLKVMNGYNKEIP